MKFKEAEKREKLIGIISISLIFIIVAFPIVMRLFFGIQLQQKELMMFYLITIMPIGFVSLKSFNRVKVYCSSCNENIFGALKSSGKSINKVKFCQYCGEKIEI